MDNQPHESKPDISNLLKALEDAVYPDSDEHSWRYGEMEKVWGARGPLLSRVHSQLLNYAAPRSGVGLNELLALLETDLSVDCTDN